VNRAASDAHDLPGCARRSDGRLLQARDLDLDRLRERASKASAESWLMTATGGACSAS
jgi:hypothetical protein